MDLILTLHIILFLLLANVKISSLFMIGNMKQNLYQKAMQSADPLIEIQNNPQLKPKEQFMQQKGSNITPLLNYDAFNGIYNGNEMQETKESNVMPFIIAAGAIGAVFILGRKL